MSEIRVTYSGLISLIISITTLGTGFLFMIIISRTLSMEELGTWHLILTLLMYMVISESIFSYWVPREINRGTESGKSALFFSSIFSVGFAIFYFVIILFLTPQYNIDFDILLSSSILLPLMFVSNTLNAIIYARKPHQSSYVSLFFDLSRIPLALFFIYFLDLDVLGVIITMAFSYVTSILFQLYFAKGTLHGFKINHLKKWLKFSWIPLYPAISGLMFIFDVLIFTLIIGSISALAIYAVSQTIGRLLNVSAQISRASYPKLLQGGKIEYLQQNFTLLFYIMIPFSALSIIFAKPGLFVLNPIYSGATIVVILIVIKTFLVTLSDGTLVRYLYGVEEVDRDKTSNFKDYVKSKLFVLPTIRLITFSSYLVILSIGLLILKNYSLPEIDLVMWWVILSIIPLIPYNVYIYRLARKKLNIKFEIKLISKYIISSIVVFGLIYLLMDKILIYDENYFIFIPSLLVFLFASVLMYIGLTCLIDSRTRNLLKSIIREIRKIKKNT